MTLTIWSNTRLDENREWSAEDVADLFLGSRFHQMPGDLAERLRLFLTDQDGPIRGVCEQPALIDLITELANRGATSGKDTA